MSFSLSLEPISLPTGGGVLLDLTGGYGTLTAEGTLEITRTAWLNGTIANTQSLTWSTASLPMFVLDVGDFPLDPGPLDSSMTYSYSAVDSRGTVESTGMLSVASAITVAPDSMTKTFVRLLQAAVNNLVLAPGFGPAEVTDVMPLADFPPMPIIVVNLDMLWQDMRYGSPIGSDIVNPNQNNLWTKPVLANRTWRVTIASLMSEERAFYRDAMIGILQVLQAVPFAFFGRDMKQEFAANDSATSAVGTAPGIYSTEILVHATGPYEATVQCSYGTIAGILTVPDYGNGITDDDVVGNIGTLTG